MGWPFRRSERSLLFPLRLGGAADRVGETNFRTLTLDSRAFQFSHDLFGMLCGHFDKQMIRLDLNGSNNVWWQAGFTEDCTDYIFWSHASFGSQVHDQALHFRTNRRARGEDRA